VFRKTLGRRFESGFRPFQNCILLGDSAYKVEDYLIPMKEQQRGGIYDLFYRS
jgi:hypothetical protein